MMADDNGVAVADAERGRSLSAMALRTAFQRGSMPEAMGVFKLLNAPELIQTLTDVGFSVDPGLVSQGRNAIFTSVKGDLGQALGLRTDGFGLRALREQGKNDIKNPPALVSGSTPQSFAAKVKSAEVVLPFDAADFNGNIEAARVIQKVMRSSAIDVAFLGDALPRERQALLMVAGQGLAKGVQGFGFDGIAGKYAVPLSLAQVHELHQNAAKAVAEESVRSTLTDWAQGHKPKELHDYVLDSIQRLLQGSVSVASAQTILDVLKSGELNRHAGEIGAHQSATLLLRQGLDVNALPVLEQVKPLGLEVVEPNRERGQYFGSIVALDHRALMLKVSRADLIELPLVTLPGDMAKPQIGDSIRLGFKNGVQSISVMSRHGVENGLGR